MMANKSCGTRPELALGRLLWSCGIRYRKHVRDVPGRPDFCIKKYRMAIFVDGEFWHGCDWEVRRERIKSNREFWIAKIERNMRRDADVTGRLRREGWAVFRFWESDIRRRPGACLRLILSYLAGFTALSAPSYIPLDYRPYEMAEIPAAAEPDAPYGGRNADGG